MFESSEFPKSLDEDVFDAWLENGRQQKLSYNYLLVVWNEQDMEYQPVYAADRETIENYKTNENIGTEILVAAYDLYSESRIA